MSEGASSATTKVLRRRFEEAHTALLATTSELDATRDALRSTTQELTDAQSAMRQLQQQVDWFKRQLFDRKSERVLPDPGVQASLFGEAAAAATPEVAGKPVSYVRRPKQRSADCVTDTGLRFDDSVPRQTVRLPEAGEGELIDEKVTYKLAQRPGSYLVLEFIQAVRKHAGQIVTAPAAGSVVEGSLADVSFLAGMAIDKFVYHMPLYRQHQRLEAQNITLARSTLTNLLLRSIRLLEPIAEAQYRHVLQGAVITMDETPIRAGRKGDGKMKIGQFWPLYGEDDEVCFRFLPGRQHAFVPQLLGPDFKGTLLTDGYAGYAKYAKAAQCTHAECWAHTRRGFEQALPYFPEASRGLELIRELYKHEAAIRKRGLEGADALHYRTEHSLPVVQAFWAWCFEQRQRVDLLPKDPLAKALAYAWERRAALQVFLSDPNVPIDTNHVERTIRPLALGKKNYLFCWTELGATAVATIQSLLQTCRLQGVDPYTYLVDVLQRIDVHPQSRVIELTPRLWKQHFAEQPFRSFVELGDRANMRAQRAA